MKPCLSSLVKPAFFVLVFGFSKSLRKEREKIDVVLVISGFNVERVLQNLLSTGELVERFSGLLR